MKFTHLLAAVTALCATTAVAQEPKTATAEATLMLSDRTSTLRHAVAYEATIDNDDVIVVVFSGSAITADKLVEARKTESQGGEGAFQRPFLKVAFKKSGELKHWSAGAGGTTLGRRSGKASGELKLQEARVSGTATEPADRSGVFPVGFDARFDVALIRAGESLPASTAKKGGPAADVKPSVSGVFRGNGKEAKLSFVSARWGEPFSGKPGIVLVLTEKDHSKDKKPDTGAMLGRFGNALIIAAHEDGAVYGCQVVHTAMKTQGFSSSGKMETSDFSYADGKVQGELTTRGPSETFGETWEVDLKFVAPLGEDPKAPQAAESKKAQEQTKTAATSKRDDDEDADEPGAATAAGALKAKDLALTKDAADVEYKTTVEQIAFTSKSDVKSACAELAANLKAQGWAVDGRDMVQPTSSILRRKRGDAKLTIFVKPQGGGSEIKMMTEGLSWEGQ